MNTLLASLLALLVLLVLSSCATLSVGITNSPTVPGNNFAGENR